MARNMEDNIFTAEEAAELLGVKVMTVYQWVHRKKIRCFRIGEGRRLMRFHRREVESLIEKRSRKASDTRRKKRAKGKIKDIDLDSVIRDSMLPPSKRE